ncbi:hypothetical protein OG978_37110 [Streptomyces sp. NBC_01591]|uniref:hypothetical protein n=1 Tax=Streptomyces sp. NBC_01591 TaxID=2975888 RepID=UPI002DD7A40F|nr:hypothetical protein [Streptomyces sp. NBC_01591]WSD72529.1 hypothetical protein OG978_37110 [Streptomyces sp. NBC_01591]
MDVSDPTLIMGLHGVFHRHPWIARVLAENYLEDEDVFSLAVARAEAYGWSSTHLGRGPLDGCRWGHNDAGEDWTEDDRVRQLAWLQVAVEVQLHGQRLPLLPVATVLSDVLHHMGTYTLTGLHTVVPLQLSTDDGPVYLSQAADWVATAGPGPAADCVITIAARESAGLSNRAQDVNVLILECSYGRLAIHPGRPSAPTGGLAPSLVGEVQTEGMQNVASIHCSLPAWSLDSAIWAAEVTATAVRDVGVTEPVLLTISQNGDDPAQNV